MNAGSVLQSKQALPDTVPPLLNTTALQARLCWVAVQHASCCKDSKAELLLAVPRGKYSADFACGTGQSIGPGCFHSPVEEKDLALSRGAQQVFCAGKIVHLRANHPACC